MAILELEERRKKALKELVSYKATAKAMEKDMATQEEKAKLWEQRAMAAVKGGDDELAKQCLKERKQALTDSAKVKADRDEAAGYAIELNRSRKKGLSRCRFARNSSSVTCSGWLARGVILICTG